MSRSLGERREGRVRVSWVGGSSADSEPEGRTGRDTQKQDRLPIPELANELRARLGF